MQNVGMGATIEILSNTQARLTGVTRQQAVDLDESLAIEVPGAQYDYRYRNGWWDGKRRFFDVKSGRFPFGLLGRVKAFLRDAGVKGLTVADKRAGRIPTFDPRRVHTKMLHGVELRDYQLAAIKALLDNKIGIINIATNGGKSAVAAGALAAFKELPDTLYLVHKKVLLRQAVKDIARYLGLLESHIGQIGSGISSPRRITVSTVQSLYKKTNIPIVQKYLKSIQLVIGDECHHYKSTGMFLKVLNCIDAPYRLFLSGTPFPDAVSRVAVESACGPVIYKVSNQQLVDLGVSADPTVEVVSYEAQAISSLYEWHVLYKMGVVESPERNAVVVNQIKRCTDKGLQVLILVQHTWHGTLLSALLDVLNVNHVFLHGKMPIDQVEAGRVSFEEKKVSALIATPIFDEGVNIGGVQVLVVADGGKSFRSLLQKVGRALRKKTTGRNEVLIIDFSDKTNPVLAKHSLRRIEIYQEEGFKLLFTEDDGGNKLARENHTSSDDAVLQARVHTDESVQQVSLPDHPQELDGDTEGSVSEGGASVLSPWRLRAGLRTRPVRGF